MKDKLLHNSHFHIIVGFTALLIAGCAAFFSVYGIGTLFAGAMTSAMIMAGALELGKIVATTFLYRYWKKSIFLVKSYLTIAVLSLMVITSAGIFGFLSSAYQKSSLEFMLNQEKIKSMEASKGFYTNQIEISASRISVLNDARKIQEGRLSEALTNIFLSRNPIQLQQLQEQTIKLIDQSNNDIKTENDKIEQSRSKLLSIDEQVNEMKIGATSKKDIQTFKFLADALHTDLDTVAKWFIISLILVFDPMAIALILAYNVIVMRKGEEIIEDEPQAFVETKEPLGEQIKIQSELPINNNFTEPTDPVSTKTPIHENVKKKSMKSLPQF